MWESIHRYVNNERANTETCTPDTNLISVQSRRNGTPARLRFWPQPGRLNIMPAEKLLAASNAIETISIAPAAFKSWCTENHVVLVAVRF
jgi:hypothetical protein